MSQKYVCTGKLKVPAKCTYTSTTATPVCRFDIAIGKKGTEPKKILWWRVNAWDDLALEAEKRFTRAGQTITITGYFKPNHMPNGASRNELTLTAIGEKREMTEGEKYAAEHGAAEFPLDDDAEPNSFMDDDDVPY